MMRFALDLDVDEVAELPLEGVVQGVESLEGFGIAGLQAEAAARTGIESVVQRDLQPPWGC